MATQVLAENKFALQPWQMTCPTCGGSGLAKNDEHGDPQQYEAVTETGASGCKTCDGHGWVKGPNYVAPEATDGAPEEIGLRAEARRYTKQYLVGRYDLLSTMLVVAASREEDKPETMAEWLTLRNEIFDRMS